MANNRGRPAFAMTRHRKQVADCYFDEIANGAVPSYARLARLCGLHDYRNARRVVRDLRKMGVLA